MDNSQSGPSQPAGNSSDFVRKLYKMLEDPSYSTIVRWGDDNDSFVVLECEKFTKSILPKHFKHSNFASFVRQLNKYDFHKVRQNNEDSGQSPYGPNAWEFKHPEFKANNKESLDNIKRKAPAPRKPSQLSEDSIPTQQIDLMNQQLVASQQQIQHLTDRFNQLTMEHQTMMQEVRRVQRTVLSHQQVIHFVMNFLQSVDARQRRESRASIGFQAPGAVATGSELSPTHVGPGDDEPSSPLQHATKLLNEMNSEIQFGLSSLESMGGDMQARLPGAVPTPPLDPTQRNGTIRPATSGGSSSSMGFTKMNGDLEQIVYPVGAVNGIDPMYSEHINNIPYSLPPKELDPSDPRRQYVDGRKKSAYVDPGWIRSPNILLVEDDQTCRQIGSKFLLSFCCVVDSAMDGLEALSKIEGGAKYDLILMDIIMPRLDGVSACNSIRRYDNSPIIAMTSNIRTSDIELYFQNGMNDVLPKPFTRQSLLNVLEKHLTHLKTGMQTSMDGSQLSLAAMPQSSAAPSVKDENSPGQSPSTMNNWQSPSQFQGVSPINPSMPNQYMQQPAPTSFGLEPNGVQYQAPAPPAQVATLNPAASAARNPHRRQASEMSGQPEVNGFSKRQRMFAHTNPAVVNPMQMSMP